MCPTLALTVSLSILSSYIDICEQFVLSDRCPAAYILDSRYDQTKVKNCNNGSKWDNNGIWWCMGLTNKIPIYCPVMFYCRDCNKRSLSEVKNLMIRLSSGSILLDTCLFMAILKSSFTPLSAPRVEIRRWLWKILMLVSYSKSTQWSYLTCILPSNVEIKLLLLISNCKQLLRLRNPISKVRLDLSPSHSITASMFKVRIIILCLSTIP